MGVAPLTRGRVAEAGGRVKSCATIRRMAKTPKTYNLTVTVDPLLPDLLTRIAETLDKLVERADRIERRVANLEAITARS